MVFFSKKYKVLLNLFVSASLFLILSACKNNTPLLEDEFLLRTGDSVITVGDYMDSLEVAKTAYSHSLLQEPEAFRKIQLRLFSQLAEEMIVLEIAKEKNIVVSETEIDSAVNEIKKDYPDDVFNEMLIENAITFELWKATLKRRLLMEKVLAEEPELDIHITPEIIEKYYKKNNFTIDNEFQEDSEKRYGLLIQRIRLEKKQENYQSWIEKKKKDYSIEVNEKVWEKITGN